MQDYFGEAFCLHSIPCNVGEGQNGIHHQQWPNLSGEAILMEILVTDGMGEGNLGTMTTFCHHDQSKMEASDALSALCQCDSLEPSVVVVRRYTNTPYIPWGFSHLPYLDVNTLSRGASSAQFLVDQLHLCRLLPFSDTEVVFPQEEGEIGLKVFPHFWKALWQRSEEEHCLSDLISLSVPCWPLIPIKKRAPRQMEDQAFTQPSSFDKMSIKPELSWSVSWSRKYMSWLEDMTIGKSSWPRDMRGGEHRWSNRQMPFFKKLFPGQLGRPYHITALVYFLCSFLQYMSRLLATAAKQDENVPVTTNASEPKGSPAPGPSSSPDHPPGTPPLPGASLPDISSVGIPLVGYLIAVFLAIPTQKKWDHSPSSSLRDHCDKRTHVDFQEVEARSKHSSAQGNQDMPKLVPEAGPSFNQQQGQEPTSPSSQSNQGHCSSWWWYWGRKVEEYWWSGLIWFRLVQGGCGWLWYGHSFQGLCQLFRKRWSDHTNGAEEIPKEGTSFL